MINGDQALECLNYSPISTHDSPLDSSSRIPKSGPMDMKKVKYAAVGIVIILLGIVIFQNFEEKTIKILFASIRMPVALLLILTFGIGMIAGWIGALIMTKKNASKNEE